MMMLPKILTTILNANHDDVFAANENTVTTLKIAVEKISLLLMLMKQQITNIESHPCHFKNILSTICSPKEGWMTKGNIKEMQKVNGRDKEKEEGGIY